MQTAIHDGPDGHRSPFCCGQYLLEPSGSNKKTTRTHRPVRVWHKKTQRTKNVTDKNTSFIFECYNDSDIFYEARKIKVALTMVLMPWENGSSWISPGTKLRVSRAEQRALEWAVAERRKRHGNKLSIHHNYLGDTKTMIKCEIFILCAYRLKHVC